MKWNLASAQKAREAGRLGQWVEEYLQVPEWQNLGLLRRVQTYGAGWTGPFEMEIAGLVRVAGPGEQYHFAKDPETWEEEIASILACPASTHDFPPIIAWREDDGEINVADDNHRLDAYARLGWTTCWLVLSNAPLRSEEEREARRKRLSERS